MIALSVSGYGLIQRLRTHKDDMSIREPYELTLSEWKVSLKETWRALFDKRLLTLSGGVAFYASLAVLPALAGGLALLGIFAGADRSSHSLDIISSYLPDEFARFFSDQLSLLASSRSTNIVAALIALVLGIWTASTAVDNLIQAFNAVYDQVEDRRLARFKLISLCLVLIILGAFLLIIILLLISTPALVARGITPWVAAVFPYLRWILILIIISSALALVYRYAPNRGKLHWRWISWGAVTAAFLWLIGTTLFFLYVQFIADFSQAYGVLAGMFVLMAWIELSCHIVILGAYVNYRLQWQAINAPTKQPTPIAFRINNLQ